MKGGGDVSRDSDTDVDRPASRLSTRNRLLIVAGAVVLVGAVLAAALLIPRSDGGGTSPTPTSSRTAATPSASPSTSAPEPTGTATTGPDAPVLPELPEAPAADAVDANGFVVQIARVEHVEGVVAAPGDVAGPAIRLTITIENTTSADLNLAFTAITAYTGADRVPAEQYTQPGGRPLQGTLAPGATADGVYLFRVAPELQGDVTIIVDYQAGQPSAVFRGDFTADRP